MTNVEFASLYRDYIDCLNERNWSILGRFVHEDVSHNGKPIGLPGYREMLERDCDDIPDLYFNIELLVAEPPHVASRLRFNCTPRGRFLGLDVNGAKVSFTENVFYGFLEMKIVRVWSVVDKAAIEDQLSARFDQGPFALGKMV